MRRIVVPKDKDAEILLDNNEALPHQLLEVVFEQNDIDFSELWHAGVFKEMNRIAGCIIDVYEDDGITDKEKLQEIIASEIFGTKVKTDKLSQIKMLFIEALQRETGVYFYF
ncbi:hypothetical protein [Chitinophaga rhizophila]|uniref:Uncharacterized protein n=1 Tax=Chitinophaga rhizophila TaxID=2866212 RepID=A0ABS7GH43_9BACT|nr:hypothetical protein [Chitinophaga rhizophila]MBW8687011.1 hypothetical protein [Chitinophaga rhizophila]